MPSRAKTLTKSVHSSEQDRLCALLVIARKRAGLTQQKLAERLRKPQSFVAKYEGGERRLDVVEFVIVMQAMEQDPLRLIKALIRS